MTTSFDGKYGGRTALLNVSAHSTPLAISRGLGHVPWPEHAEAAGLGEDAPRLVAANMDTTKRKLPLDRSTNELNQAQEAVVAPAGHRQDTRNRLRDHSCPPRP